MSRRSNGNIAAAAAAEERMGKKIDCTYVCSGEIEKSQSDKSEIENVERDS